jgi:predicted dehydrogenase
MHQTPIKWGILGCGKIAEMFVRSMSAVADGEIITCAARQLSRAEQFANEHAIQHCSDSYEQLAKHPEIDAVYIATTHNAHYENVILCLQAGKHVLCEKPITVNADQANKLYQYAKQRDLLLMEAVWTRFLPAIRALQGVLKNGDIGNILSLSATFAISGEFSETHRLKDPNTAGGSLLDLGIYPITMAYLTFGCSPLRMQSSSVIGTTGVDERAYMLFDYEGGKQASLCCSFSHSLPTEAIIGGTKGYIRVPNFLGAKSFVVHMQNGENFEHDHSYNIGENFKFEIEEFHYCLKAELLESSIYPSNDSLSVMKTMDELRSQWHLTYSPSIEAS